MKLGSDVYGNITRIENVIADMGKIVEDATVKLENLNQQFENAKKDVKIPFDKEQELQEKIERLNELNKELEINDKENEIIDDDIQETQENNSPEKECQDYEKDDFR